MRPARQFVLIAMVLSTVACDAGRAAGDGVSIRDSAGIEIVESATPRWRSGQEWRVSETPLVSIGSALGGDPVTQFASIAGIVRFEDGRILVVDGQAAELRFFDSTGAHLQTVGRKGGGPGEFSSTMLSVDRLAGDSLLVMEVMPPRQSLFAASGSFVRLVPPVRIAGSPIPATASGHFADGAAIVTPLRPIAERTGSWVDSTNFFVVTAGADTAVAFGRFPHQRFTGRGRSIAPLAFGPAGRFSLAGDRFYYGFPERFEIAEYARDGSLARLIRREWSPVAVSAAIRDAHREAQIARATTPIMRGRLEVTEYAETFPAYDLLRSDRAGNLWVRSVRTDESVAREQGRRSASPQWSVFDADGVWLGEVLIPHGLDVREIGSDYVAGVWYDEDDVPSVRVYRLIKS